MKASTQATLLWLGLAWLLFSKKSGASKTPPVYPPAPDLPVQIPIPPNPLKNNPPR